MDGKVNKISSLNQCKFLLDKSLHKHLHINSILIRTKEFKLQKYKLRQILNS
jgi:hypothetical protein